MSVRQAVAKYAQEQFGFGLLDHQLDHIEAWESGKTVVDFAARREGMTTALRVYQMWKEAGRPGDEDVKPPVRS